MKTRLRMHLVALALGAIVVASLAGMLWQMVRQRSESDARMLADLGKLQAANAELDTEMLRARVDLALNYDRLADLEQELLARLKVVSVHESVRRLVKWEEPGSLYDATKKKLQALDNIKFRHAVVVNSSRYLPIALALARAAAATAPSDGAAASARQLEAAALAFSLAAPGADARLRAQTERIERRHGGVPELVVAARHAEKIRMATNSLNTYTAEFFKADVGDQIAGLSTAYQRWKERAERASDRLELALGISAIGLLAAIAWMLRELARMTRSARRFVPYEFLDALGKGALTEVRAGDAVRKEMSVLFSDIRGFTHMSEKRTAVENFTFMNAYHAAMEGPIRVHDGFVIQYLGDGIVALFSDADDAVRAAIDMFAALVTLNGDLDGAAPIGMGIGVNTGAVMLGTFGGRERMNAGVISDAVNVSARVEELTKQYGVRLLISEHTRARVRDRSCYVLRTVDKVQVRGTERPLVLYEVVDVDEPALRAAKSGAILERHEQATTHLFSGRFDEARTLFERNREALPDDKVTAMFLERCQAYIIDPPPKTWDGATRLDGPSRADAP